MQFIRRKELFFFFINNRIPRLEIGLWKKTHSHYSRHSCARNFAYTAPSQHSFISLLINTLIKKIKTGKKKNHLSAVWLKMATMASDVQEAEGRRRVTSVSTDPQANATRRRCGRSCQSCDVDHSKWLLGPR